MLLVSSFLDASCDFKSFTAFIDQKIIPQLEDVSYKLFRVKYDWVTAISMLYVWLQEKKEKAAAKAQALSRVRIALRFSLISFGAVFPSLIINSCYIALLNHQQLQYCFFVLFQKRLMDIKNTGTLKEKEQLTAELKKIEIG